MKRIKVFIYNTFGGWIKNYTIFIKFSIWCGIINSNLSPKMCECGCEVFKSKVTDTLDGYTIVEKEYKCTKCDKIVGYWSYGNWIF